MKHKLVTLMLIVLTIGTVFAGCSKKGDTNGTGEVTNNKQTSDPTVVEEEPYTVTMVVHGSQPKDEVKVEAKINEILQRELNTNLDLVVLPWGSADQQKQLMLSGDEKIDCFIEMGSLGVNRMRAGTAVDLTNLVDKYGTNIKKIFNEQALEGCTFNGFLFGIPTQIERGSVPCAYLRKDIVDKYNIDLSEIKEPKDLEKIYEMLKEKEPNMTMIYSSATSDTPLSRLNTADLLGDGNLVLMNQTENTTVENLYATEWYKNTALMLHDWYNKGFMNQDVATTTVNWRDAFKTGDIFSMMFLYHPATKMELQTSTGYEFETVLFRDKPIINSTAYNSVVFCIAHNSENPEKVMQTLDYIYGSKEVMDLLNWGIEGEDYVYADQAKDVIKYPDGVTIDNVGYSLNLGWALPNQFISHIWEGSDPEQWQNMQDWNDSGDLSKALGFTFDTTGYETQIASINNVVAQYNGAISSGSVDPEKYIPEFLNALEKTGINDLLKAKQDQLNAWLEKK